MSRESFGKVGDLPRASRRHGSCYGEVPGKFRGFQTIATCRDGLKNSRDKSATSPFACPCLQETGKSAINQDVTGLLRACRGRRGKVGIVEFGLNQARRPAYPCLLMTGHWCIAERCENNDIYAFDALSIMLLSKCRE